MTKVEVRNGNVDNALKRFKIKVARSGVPSELKKHKCYEKPGVRRRNELKEMIKNSRKKNRSRDQEKICLIKLIVIQQSL